MYKNVTSYIIIGTLSTGPKGCGLTEGALYNKVSDWVDWMKKEMDQLGEKADDKNCKKMEDKVLVIFMEMCWDPTTHCWVIQTKMEEM